MISLATVRERWASFLGSFVAVALGVAVVTMSALILLSGGTGVPERLAGAPVLVRAPAGSRQGRSSRRTRPGHPHAPRNCGRSWPGCPAYAQPSPTGPSMPNCQASSRARANGRATDGPRPRSPPTDCTRARNPRRATTSSWTVPSVTALATASPCSPPHGPQRFTVSGTLKGPGYYVTDACATDLTGGIRVIGLTLEQGASAPAVASAAERAVSAAGGGERYSSARTATNWRPGRMR